MSLTSRMTPPKAIECMTSTWLAGAHSNVPVVREAYMSRISTQANTAIAVSLSASITERHTSSMNRLFSLFCMGIRIHKGFAPLHSWCRTAPPPSSPDDGPIDPEEVWQEQIAKHLVPSPGRHIYPPNASGQYDLRLRSQLRLPPEHTVFLLIPTVPLAQTDPHHTHTPPLHRLVANIQLLSQAYIGFISLPEAIFHANHTVRYSTSIRAVRRDPTSTRFLDLSTVVTCNSHNIMENSSACRSAVSLGLMMYFPYGRMGTSPFMTPPGKLSAEDIQTPTPGWAPPTDPTPDSPAQGAHVAAREWADSLLMTEHLVAHASRWMMAFHDSFLNKRAVVSTLTLSLIHI